MELARIVGLVAAVMVLVLAAGYAADEDTQVTQVETPAR
jgi:hypothetical protein